LITVSEIVKHLEVLAPLSLAADWDNVGLLLGDPSQPVSKILTCLTVTSEVVEEAVSGGFQLVITHHPVLFKGAKKLTTQSGDGKLLWPLARAGVSVYSAHTAFDDTTGGINDGLSDLLGLENRKPIRPKPQANQVKIVVFVPLPDREKVLNAMFEAGAGVIGEYRECSYRLQGTGTFYPTENTNPVIGQRGRREEVEEERLEMVCPETNLSKVIRAMRSAHPYEVVAFDVYPLKAMPSSNGSGRIGTLKSELALRELGKLLRTQLLCGPVQLIGNPNKKIKTVAIACGAAGEYLSDAIRAGADCFLSGEMRFHDYLHAQASGVGLVLPGHYATERFAMEHLAKRLSQEFAGITAIASEAEKDPVTWC